MSVKVENFQPLQDYVVVLIPKLSNKTAAGIMKSERMIEQEMRDIPQVFEVVAVGEKVETVQVGQYVLCTRVSNIPVESNKEGFEVAVVRMFDIVGVTDEV